MDCYPTGCIPENRPKEEIMATITGVPVLDMSRLHEPETMRALDVACRDWGFFQVINHGISESTTDSLQREMRSFFELPSETKSRVSRTSENVWGFFDQELTKNILDRKQIYDCGPPDDIAMATRWPKDRPQFEQVLLTYADDCKSVAMSLLAAISANLGMSNDFLGKDFQPDHSSFLRLNYYPVSDLGEAVSTDVRAAGQLHMGVHEHTDAGALTVLLQDDQAGLEVHHGEKWYLVEPRADALVVNVGDIVQVWSNDRYRAALHRVVESKDRARFSAPYFLNPAYETVYEPVSALVDIDSPPRYRPIQWGEFRALRAAGDYRDDGQEIQIDQYRTPEES